MTAQERIEAELKRKAMRREYYRRNFEAFARDQIKIRGKRPGEIVTLDIGHKPAQQILHAKCQEQLKSHGYIRVRAIKARQQGFSTYSEGRALHGSVLNRNCNSLLIANDKDTTETIFRIARFAYDSLKPEFKPIERYNNKREIVMENPDAKTRGQNPGLNSRMTFQQAKELAGTGSTIHFLHTSETSKWPPNACEMLESNLLPALHLEPGTAHIDESTAFTRGDYFREKCERTRSGKDFYAWVLVPWWLDPSYAVPLDKGEKFKLNNEERAIQKLAAKGQKHDGVPPWQITHEQFKWRRITIGNRIDGERLFLQEYLQDFESAWVTMDVNVFDLDALNRQEQNICIPRYFATLKPSSLNNIQEPVLRPPIEGLIDEDEDYVAIWRKPEPSHAYYMGIDVALGIEGGNWSVMEVFDGKTGEQVAEAHLHVDPDDLGWLAFTLGMYYNRAQINTELTGPGYNTDARLKKLCYPNLYIWRNRERVAPKLTQYTGWKTSRESKKFLIGMTRPLLNHDKITIHSRLLLNEMRHFVVVPGFVEDQYYAETGDDDAVMSLMFALVAAEDENYVDDSFMPREEIKDEGLLKKIREKEVAKAVNEGPWAVDTTEFGGYKEDGLDGALTSLKGWD